MYFSEIIINFFKFFVTIPIYLMRRARQLSVFFISGVHFFFEFLNSGKNIIVSRLFWGRGNMYRNIVPTFMILITIVITLSGLIGRIGKAAGEDLFFDGQVTGLDDLLQQGGSIETVLSRNPELPGIQIKKHIVQQGETLRHISEKYNVTMDTIRWASPDAVSPFTNEISAGAELIIPEINGVVYEVKPGDSLDSIISLASVNNSEANKFNILEFNGLTEPVNLSPGQKLFIPDGNLKTDTVGPAAGIPRGVFINPLSHPSCQGYKYSRGFLSYHNGVDLAKWPACPIVAVANGFVTYAGWRHYGEGYMVEIDHGGGIVTHYYHGDGTFWVKSGERVNQGDPIMMMGRTGNSTGVHLHFTLFKDGTAINPYGFVPY